MRCKLSRLSLFISFCLLLTVSIPAKGFSSEIFEFITDFNPQDSVQGVAVQKIDSLFANYDNINTPGCAVSVFKDAETLFNGFYGSANLDYEIPLGSKSSFYMASISKQVTAAAASLLLIREELDYNEHVSEYLEEWPDWASGVLVKHLFNHTSGLPDIYGLMDIADISISNVMTLEEYMEIITAAEELKFEAGTDYSYTNSGYTTLAYLIQTVTGSDFSEFVDKELLKPLGMTNTHFHDDRHRVIPNRVYSYAPGTNKQFRHTYLSNFQGVGPGGLYSTHEDWQKWEAYLYGSLEVSGELEEVKNLLLRTETLNGDVMDYARGLQIDSWKGENINGHSGSFMGFKNDYRRYPDSGYSFLTLCNRQDANPGEKNRQLANLFLEERFNTFLRTYEGKYSNSELDTEYKLTVENGELILNRSLSPSGAMEEESLDQWQAGSWEFEFYRDNDGNIAGFKLSTSRAKNVEFEKM